MGREKNEDRVKEVISDTLCIELNRVTDESSFESFGVDSFERIELVVALEEEFEIEIDDAEAEGFKTVADAIRCVKERKPDVA